MLKLSKRMILQSLAFGLVAAMAGFCYATATASREAGNGAASAASRAVGTYSVKFTNALLTDRPAPLPDVFDLGDACYGSTITRYITATGGIRPYSFNQTNLNPLLAPYSSLSLGASGALIGSITTGTTSPLVFNVTVSDSSLPAKTVSGDFQINVMVCNPNEFRFAVDRINNGVVGQSYFGKLETLGGDVPVRFSVIPNTVTLNGQAKGTTGLEPLGLSLAADGTISGRPLQAGLVRFVARAVDRNEKTRGPAKDRSNTVVDQVITFNIEDNTVSSTDFTVLSCSVKGDVGRVGKDSIRFTANGYLGGGNNPTLFGSDFKFFIGGASFEGVIDDKGQVTNRRGGPLVFADGSTMSVKFNPRTGAISGQVNKATIGKLLDAVNISDRSTRRYSVGIQVGAKLVAADMLEFATKKKNDLFQLNYALGKIGQPMGGGFQLVNVRGVDKTTISGNDGVAWAFKFFIIPRFGIDANPGLAGVDKITVHIGTNFNQKIDGKFLTSSPKGDIQLVKNDFQGETVSKLKISERKFMGTLSTQPLSVLSTGILAAHNKNSQALNIPFGIDIDRSGNNSDFFGESSKLIIPIKNKNSWTDQADPH